MLHGERNLTKALLTWGGTISLLSLPLSVYTVYWWLILVFGAVLPVAIGLGEWLADRHVTLGAVASCGPKGAGTLGCVGA